MAEANASKLKRLRRRRNNAMRLLKGIRIAEARYAKRVKLFNARIRKLTVGDVPPMNSGGWHPDAVENQSASPLEWTTGKPKIVWHTTEGSGLPAYSGSQPHFTLNPKSGALWQHVPIRGGAYALQNLSGGVETNRAHALQVELIGFASETQSWSDAEYANIAKLARWLEKHGGVPRSCSVTFRSDSTHKILDWPGYSGHCGHQHVPENSHWDPGLFQIQKVI